MIKIGEYVRTKRDGIGKVVEVTETYCRKDDGFKIWFITNKDLKHSKNIIDLIEVGDYVNGHKVTEIKNGEITEIDNWFGVEWKNTDEPLPPESINATNKSIKSIVTKEQFKSIEYRLED